MAIPADLKTFWLDLRTGKDHAKKRALDAAIIAFSDVIRATDREVHCPKTGTKPPYEVYCEAHYERGLAYAQTKKHDEAFRDFDAVIAEAKNPAVVKSIKTFLINSYLQRGILFARQGDTRQAIDDFTHVIQLNKCHSEAYFHRAIAYKGFREPKLAKEDFDEVMRIDPFGFPQLRGFLNLPSPKACVTFPDIRFGKTLGDQETRLEH